MKRLTLLPLLLILLSACGARIVANYPPVPSASASAELPDSWYWEGRSVPIVMEGSGYRGFFIRWRDPFHLLERARTMDKAGSPYAQREIKDMEALIEEDLAPIRVAMFFSEEGELRLDQKGALEIIFSNGSTTQDEGVVVFANGNTRADRSKKYDSRKNKMNINKTWQPLGEPIYLMILINRKYLGEEIASVKLL